MRINNKRKKCEFRKSKYKNPRSRAKVFFHVLNNIGRKNRVRYTIKPKIRFIYNPFFRRSTYFLH